MAAIMTSDEFRAYLRDLQKDPYLWSNDYFAWEKPDGKLFMVGTMSHSFDEIQKYEFTPEFNCYSAKMYNLNPNGIHLLNGRMPYDPVEKLVSEVENYKFLGKWRDKDLFMDDPKGKGQVLACGRWDLAKKHILERSHNLLLSEQISQANGKVTQSSAIHPPDRAGERFGR